MEAKSNSSSGLRTFNRANIVKQRAELIRHLSLFSQLSQDDCERVVALAHERHYHRGKHIFFEGDPVRQIVLLTSGSVKLSQIGPNGQEVILRVVGAGEPLCVECFPKCVHCSTASALRETSALVWESTQFEALRERFHVLGRNISCVLIQTLNDLAVRYGEVSTARVSVRLSRQLMRLQEQAVPQPTDCPEVVVSQRDLAQLTGTTIFTVSRLLHEWEVQGIVRVKREALHVLDLPALRRVSESESLKPVDPLANAYGRRIANSE